jgi:hypothetical protein
MAYKEQARLNQAACNALMAHLDCQKVTCDAVEKDLLQCHSHREALAATLSTDTRQIDETPCLQGQNIVDVSSCVSLFVTNENHEGEESVHREDVEYERDGWSDREDEKANEIYKLQMQLSQSQELQQVEQEYLDNYSVTGEQREIYAIFMNRVEQAIEQWAP